MTGNKESGKQFPDSLGADKRVALFSPPAYLGTMVKPHLYSLLAGIRYCGSGMAPQLS